MVGEDGHARVLLGRLALRGGAAHGGLGALVHEDESKLDVPEVLDGDEHVVEDGHVLAVEAEEALERCQRTEAGAQVEECRVCVKEKEKFVEEAELYVKRTICLFLHDFRRLF